MMTHLQVPYALNARHEIHSPVTASRGETFFCPGCGQPVVLRQGAVKLPHFAHRATTACQPNHNLAQTAKRLLQQAIRAWKAGQGDQPNLQRQCQVCLTPIAQPLPDKVEAARLDERLPDGTPVDLALWGHDQPQAAIKVEVNKLPQRAVPLPACPLPLIVLAALAVIDRPTSWTPLADGFRPLTCRSCRAVQGDFFLHGEIGSPFAIMGLCATDTPPAFERDLMRLAVQASASNGDARPTEFTFFRGTGIPMPVRLPKSLPHGNASFFRGHLTKLLNLCYA
jgi:hypothetical protein